MQQFVVNGTRVFGKASKGKYQTKSDAVKGFKEEIMLGKSSHRDDMENRMNDRRNIEEDVRRSFNKLVLNNG